MELLPVVVYSETVGVEGCIPEPSSPTCDHFFAVRRHEGIRHDGMCQFRSKDQCCVSIDDGDTFVCHKPSWGCCLGTTLPHLLGDL
jgi:hypothetical protein